MTTKVKILYLDDEKINLQLFDIIFSKKYIVITCNDPVKALEELEIIKDISIVISDMKMPVMNGIEFVTKAKLNFPDKKYYILTGYEITKEINEALNSGLILKYFSKPINKTEIEATIGNLTESDS